MAKEFPNLMKTLIYISKKLNDSKQVTCREIYTETYHNQNVKSKKEKKRKKNKILKSREKLVKTKRKHQQDWQLTSHQKPYEPVGSGLCIESFEKF